MTQYPEAWLCRELGMAVVNIALITDYDAGVHEGTEAVNATDVLEVFQENAARIQAVVLDLIGRFPADLDALGALAALGPTRGDGHAIVGRGHPAVRDRPVTRRPGRRPARPRSGSASARSAPSPAGGSRAPGGSTRPATPGSGAGTTSWAAASQTVPVVEGWTILADGRRRDGARHGRAVRR